MIDPPFLESARLEATAVFEDAAYAVRWLETPNAALGDRSPRSLLDTRAGLLLVRRELAAIEHGLPN